MQGGEVFNPETAVDSLLKRLENSPGMADNIAVIRYYAEHSDFVLDSGIASPIAYDPDTDVIRYNPSIALPEGADRDGILVYELAHRADHLMYSASENSTWQKALYQVESLIAGQKEEIESWFTTSGKYASNAFLSDIVSAIFRGDVDVPYSHPPEYWSQLLAREREIFANLSAINALDDFGIDEIPDFLNPLYDVFAKIVQQGR